MLKAVLLDADGVLIKPRKKFFSTRLIEEFGVDKEKVDKFVHIVLIPSMIGKVDLRTELANLIQEWNLKMSVDELLNIWWTGERELNNDVLATVKDLKQAGMATYLVTDQEKNRAHYLMNTLGLRNYFNSGFFSYEVGYTKSDAEYWQYVLGKLKDITPNEILYWDDDEKNIQKALTLGMYAKLFTTNEAFLEEIKSLGL